MLYGTFFLIGNRRGINVQNKSKICINILANKCSLRGALDVNSLTINDNLEKYLNIEL